jgi:hypothetical protein
MSLLVEQMQTKDKQVRNRIELIEKTGVWQGYVDGRIVKTSKNKSYVQQSCKKYCEANPTVSAFVEEELTDFPINQRFDFVTKCVNMVATGVTPSAIITGEGGLGKSYTVIESLDNLGLESLLGVDMSDSEMDPSDMPHLKQYQVVKGYSTAKGLFRQLYENQNSIIVFDDCDSIHKDQDAVNLLKSALDSDANRRYFTWGVDSKDDNLPRTFLFRGACIFITNRKMHQLDDALKTRSMCVDLTMTLEQKIERMAVLVDSPKFLPDYTRVVKIDALRFIEEMRNKANEVSLRTLIMVARIRASNKDWESFAEYMLTNGR